jgi:hypothetical protein
VEKFADIFERLARQAKDPSDTTRLLEQIAEGFHEKRVAQE